MMALTMSRCQNVEETSHAESGAQNKQKRWIVYQIFIRLGFAL